MKLTSALAFFILSTGLLGASCDKVSSALKSIPAKVTGQVMDQNGHGRGYVAVVLVPSHGRNTIRDIAEDSGNFFIENVPPGKYTIKIQANGGIDLPTDAKEFSVGPGKTETVNVTLLPDKNSGGGSSSAGGASA